MRQEIQARRISRRCWKNNHKDCKGSWVAYPNQETTCECACHAKPGSSL